MTDTAATDVYGVGRDSGKTYHVPRIEPITFAGYVLRLVAALRIDSYEGLIDEIKTSVDNGEAPVDTIMHVLQGCDPLAVHALLKDTLTHVTISPDPKFPTANRGLLPDDITEMKTLGDILMAIAAVHFGEA